jgi:putative ABC transport system ATP-binding protein
MPMPFHIFRLQFVMIEVSSLSFQYSTSTILSFPDFVVDRGKPFLLLGESGSGKTTLLHLLGGLLRNYAGEIEVNGTKLHSLSEHALDKFRGRNIGFIFQRHHLIDALSVEQNLMMPAYLSGMGIQRRRIQEVLRKIGLERLSSSRVRELSQGQAQRVAIARSIMLKPSVILADEPTSALDDRNCNIVISLLMEAAGENQSSLIIATHDQRLKEIIGNKMSLVPA